MCACVCVWVHGPRWGNSASNNRPNRVSFHRSLQPQTFIRFPPPADTVMDGSRKSALHFCTGPRIIVYIIASNLWRELDGRGPVLKTTSVSHRNPETYWKEQEKNNFYSNKMLLLRCASLLLWLEVIFERSLTLVLNFDMLCYKHEWYFHSWYLLRIGVLFNNNDIYACSVRPAKISNWTANISLASTNIVN